MSKYDPLTAQLASHKASEWRASFADVEKVLGFALPKTAHSARGWWNNSGSQPHQRAWTGCGWEVADVDQAKGRVTFRRTSVSQPNSEGSHSAPVMTDEPAILRRLDASPKWGTAMVVGGVAIVAGLGALVFSRVRGRR